MPSGAVRGNDSLTGGNTNFDYRELFNGGGGSDTIDGGSGIDVALYRNSTSGINITLASGSGGGSDGLGGTDSLTGIEVVVGSDHDDTITGGAGDQTFQGRKGADSLDGGADTDTVDYNGDYDNNGDGFGVQVNLSSTATSGNVARIQLQRRGQPGYRWLGQHRYACQFRKHYRLDLQRRPGRQ